ncbi:sugar-transfer associated ATP-grasp domain-containing protein [Sphingoaurantiacus capsulatus]|uniref:Sugar-transfer associated ATP-grasp domain-containing protein n=1 Tax=Sphingoaurantiacus capsulatus TaxID=1771310 RepID=A0ABV7X8T6_9SPHN
MSTRLALILRPVPPRLSALPANGLRGYYYRRLWDGWSMAQRTLAKALTAARYGAAARRGALAAWRLGFTPTMFDEVEARRQPGAALAAFLDQDERKGVHALLNPGALPFDANPLKNKARFAAFCAAQGLPAPRPGPGADGLIVKPRYGSKGRGVRRLERRDGQWVANDGEIIAALSMSRWVAAQEAGGMIVQELLRTNPALRSISPGALPTLRITTCLNEKGVPEVADVALRLSLGDDRAADNFNADNLVCGVDRASGRLGPALRRIAGGFAELVAHPATRAPIAGEQLAALDAAMALACRAHAPLAPGFTVIGWDIGLAESGPALIEGNWNPGYNVMQLVHGRGLGEMRLGELYRHHLDRLPAATWHAAAPVEWAQRRL